MKGEISGNRFRKKNNYNDINKLIATERGYAMLMAVIVLMILSILGAAIIEIALRESKISYYSFIEQQAQQGVDAGVDWTMENIYQELRQEKYADSELLPDSLSFGNPVTMRVGTQLCSISISPIILVEQNGQPGTNSCTYQYTSSAIFAGASKEVQVQVVYTFFGGYYYYDNEGNLIFIPRTGFSNGRIQSYLTIS